MKRYILSMALGVFAVGAIGTYYASGTEGDVPQYKLVALEGEVAEAGKLQIGGHYVGGIGSKALELTVEGTKYRLTQSFYEKYLQDNRYLTTHYEDMKALKRDHRNFMREKSNVNGFYRDSEWVVYADSILYSPRSAYDWRAALQMEVLEEATGKAAKHRIELNDLKPVDWMNVSDVQRVGDEVHILTQVRYKSELTEGDRDNATEGFCDFVVDLRSGKLLRQADLIAEPLQDSTGSSKTAEAEPMANVVRKDRSLSIVYSQLRSQPSDYVVLETSRNYGVTGEDGKEKTVTTRAYTSYSYRSGKLTPLSESSRDYSAYSIAQSELSGERLTVLYNDSRSLAVARYHVATGELEPGELTLTAKQLGAQSIRSVILVQDRVYALLSAKDPSKAGLADSRQITAVVLDASSGKTLYRGEAAYEGPAEKAEEFRKNLWLTNVYADRS